MPLGLRKLAQISGGVGGERGWTQVCGSLFFKGRAQSEVLRVRVPRGFRKATQRKRMKGRESGALLGKSSQMGVRESTETGCHLGTLAGLELTR